MRGKGGGGEGRRREGEDAAGKGKMCIFYEYLCSLFVFSPPVSRGGEDDGGA